MLFDFIWLLIYTYNVFFYFYYHKKRWITKLVFEESEYTCKLISLILSLILLIIKVINFLI